MYGGVETHLNSVLASVLMVVSGHLHDIATVFPEKEHPVLLE
jgi:hypothetical protein